MKKQITIKDTLRIFWSYTRQYKLSFFIGTTGAGIGVMLQEILPPLIVSVAFNKLQYLLEQGARIDFVEFVPYLIAHFAVIALGVIVWRFQVRFVWSYEIAVLEKLAIDIFDHLQQLGERFHANRFGGSLVSQSTKFLRAYERTMDELTWSITTGIIAFLSSLTILALTVPMYAIVFLVLAITYFTVVFRFTKITMPYDRALAASESDRTGKLADMLTNVSAVRSFANEKSEKQRFSQQARDTSNRYRDLLFGKVWRHDLVSHSLNNLIAFSAFASGIIAITVFNAPAGSLFLAVSYTMSLVRRLREANRVFRNLNRALGDAHDMTVILNTHPEITDKPQAKKLRASSGGIAFKEVTFAYPDQLEENLFENLNLVIKPGEKIGLVGHSGGGKTTITKLLLRSLEVNKGTIQIDGQNITKVTQQSLRKAIASVPQEPLLFHRSIAENIAYGRPGASQREIEAVAKMAHAHEFVKDLPNNYKTLVGERGVKLSGGQRQRIAIARAMIKNAPILVLDEATSALDSESESLIQDALWQLMQNRTAIVIAHRLSTIQKMDRILVMEKGRIVEEGTHNELVRQKGIYSELWSHQSGGFLED